MSTSATTSETRTARPRVWLVAGGHTPDPRPDPLPIVRDDLMHIWCPGDDGLMHILCPGDDGLMHMTAASEHHATWNELRVRYDLVEVA